MTYEHNSVLTNCLADLSSFTTKIQFPVNQDLVILEFLQYFTFNFIEKLPPIIM